MTLHRCTQITCVMEEYVSAEMQDLINVLCYCACKKLYQNLSVALAICINTIYTVGKILCTHKFEIS